MTLLRSPAVRSTLLAPLTLLALVACEDPTRPYASVHLAVITFGGEPDVTATFDDGDLVVNVMTFGDGCTHNHHDEIDVDVTERVVTMTPYNTRDGGTCFDELVEILHTARVEVDESGEWLVRVIGSDGTTFVGPDAPEPVTIVIERNVIVPG